MKKIEIESAPARSGTRYPEELAAPCVARASRLVGDAAGLTQFGVLIMRVAPGSWSSHRHWHEHEDEFVYVLEGEGVLVTDAGEEMLTAGDCAGFPAGERDGHHFQNRSDHELVLLVVGARNDADWGEFSDVDMKVLPGRYSGKAQFVRKNGEPF
jgi:uncharacterized cupin superfamily protein